MNDINTVAFPNFKFNHTKYNSFIIIPYIIENILFTDDYM